MSVDLTFQEDEVIDPSIPASKLSARNPARSSARTSGGAYESTRPATPLVMPVLQTSPVSAWETR